MAGDASSVGHHQPSEFEQRRATLVSEIGESLEQVLAQINGLNRSLEGIIEIGNEFSSVEALWSQFESVMGRENENGTTGASGTSGETKLGGGEGGGSGVAGGAS